MWRGVLRRHHELPKLFKVSHTILLARGGTVILVENDSNASKIIMKLPKDYMQPMAADDRVEWQCRPRLAPRRTGLVRILTLGWGVWLRIPIRGLSPRFGPTHCGFNNVEIAGFEHNHNLA